MSKSLVLYVILAAIRDKVFISFLAMIAVGISLSVFLGSSAVLEKDQFAAVFVSSGLRLASVTCLVLFIVFYIRRSYEDRDVEYMLTKPVSRFSYSLSHIIAFTVLSLFATVFVSLAVYYQMPSAVDGVGNYNGLVYWCSSLFVELIIMSSVAFFFAMVLKSAVSASLITLAFYVLSRLIGQILGIVEAPGQFGFMQVLEQVMLFISIFVPRLDLMGQSSWLLYGLDDSINLFFIFGQGLVFCFLVFIATMVDFVRKQF